MASSTAGASCAPNLGATARRARGRAGAFVLALAIAFGAFMVWNHQSPVRALPALPLFGLGWAGIRQARRGL